MMKKFLGFMLVVSWCPALLAQAQQLRFFNSEINLGSIRENAGYQELQFKFVNSGNTEVKIDTVLSSCGCSEPTWEKESIKSGDTSEVYVSFSPFNKVGIFNKEFRVVSQKDTVLLRLKATILPVEDLDLKLNYRTSFGCLLLESKAVNFGVVKMGDTPKKAVSVYNQCNYPVVFDKETLMKPSFMNVHFPEIQINPTSFYEFDLEYDTKEANDWGYRVDNLSIKTNQKEVEILSLGVHATIEERFNSDDVNHAIIKFDSIRHEFGSARKGGTVTHVFGFRNEGSAVLYIRKIQTNCSCVTASVSKLDLQPGEKATLKVVFDTSNRSGYQNKSVYIISSSPSNSNQEIKLSGKVVTQ